MPPCWQPLPDEALRSSSDYQQLRQVKAINKAFINAEKGYIEIADYWKTGLNYADNRCGAIR